MKFFDRKKLLVGSTALVAMLGLSACHHWHDRDHGRRYYGPSYPDGHHYDRSHGHRDYRHRSDRH